MKAIEIGAVILSLLWIAGIAYAIWTGFEYGWTP